MATLNSNIAKVSTKTKQVAVIELDEDAATALREMLSARPNDNKSTMHDDLAFTISNSLRAEGF